MCGIAGILRSGEIDHDEAWVTLVAMASAISHRGPDDAGTWLDATAGVGLAHRRLSIIDLSPTGHQPMVSGSGRFVIAFNGEIYNYRDLRRDLLAAGVSFRGSSDTEVLLEAIERWGLVTALQRSYGMFALAAWDRDSRVLHLARDRIGEKPLYFGVFGDTFLFGSELKALRAHQRFVGAIDRDSVALLMRHNFIPAPHSIYQNVRKLEPGTLLSIRSAGGALDMERHAYWSLRESFRRESVVPLDVSPGEIVGLVKQALTAAVARQMVADVPVGAFLSGGVDSSLVAALMQSLSPRPVRTFTIGFWEQEYDEAPYARAIARHLGTEHTELQVTAADALSVIAALPTIYDEPFADSSQIPTYLVSKLARQSVAVSLSGDAGDELFAGYGRYGSILKRWQHLQQWPRALRRITGHSLMPAAPVLSGLLGKIPRFRGKADLMDRLQRRANQCQAAGPMDLYRDAVSYWLDPTKLVLGASEPKTVLTAPPDWVLDAPALQGMMLTDLCQYLPDDILVKVDRAAMAVSLETRVPLLDPELVDLCLRIPPSIQRYDGAGKWISRQVLRQYIPSSLFERPKMGFAIPLAQWLRCDLREWAAELLCERRLRQQAVFDESKVTALWNSHQTGKADWSFQLWGVLMFQAWEAETS